MPTDADKPAIHAAVMLTNLDNIITFTDDLEEVIHTSKYGTLLQTPAVAIALESEEATPASNKTLWQAKQNELYFLIRSHVSHSSTLTALKKPAIRESKTGCGTAAWLYLISLRTQDEGDTVESIRRQMSKLRASGMRDTSQAAFDEFEEVFDKLNAKLPDYEMLTGEDEIAFFQSAVPSSLSSTVGCIVIRSQHTGRPIGLQSFNRRGDPRKKRMPLARIATLRLSFERAIQALK